MILDLSRKGYDFGGWQCSDGSWISQIKTKYIVDVEISPSPGFTNSISYERSTRICRSKAKLVSSRSPSQSLTATVKKRCLYNEHPDSLSSTYFMLLKLLIGKRDRTAGNSKPLPSLLYPPHPNISYVPQPTLFWVFKWLLLEMKLLCLLAKNEDHNYIFPTVLRIW